MQQVTLDEAKAHLTDLIDAAAAGEEIFITKDESVSVQLVPRLAKPGKRQFGSARGRGLLRGIDTTIEREPDRL